MGPDEGGQNVKLLHGDAAKLVLNDARVCRMLAVDQLFGARVGR